MEYPRDPNEINDMGLDLHDWDDKNGEQCPSSFKKGPAHFHGRFCKNCGAEREINLNEDGFHAFQYAETEQTSFSWCIPPCKNPKGLLTEVEGIVETVRICIFCKQIVTGDSCETNLKGCRELGTAEVQYCRKLTPEEKAELEKAKTA